MAAITLIDPRIANPGTSRKVVQAGLAIGNSQPVYRHTDGKYYKGSNVAIASADIEGLAFSTSSADEDYIMVITEGELILTSTTMTEGTVYYLGDAGEIIPYADIDVGDYITRVGVATGANSLLLAIDATGVQQT